MGLDPALPKASTACPRRRRTGSARWCEARSRVRETAAYLLAASAALGAIAACAAHYTNATMTQPPFAARAVGDAQTAGPASLSKRPVRLAEAGDSWPHSIFDGLRARGKSSEQPRALQLTPDRPWQRGKSRPHRPAASPNDATRRHDRRQATRFDDGATYRTVCVRLCDGYYWPIGFANPRSHFDRDDNICQQSCNSSTALYYYRNPGGEPEDMVDLQGRPYTDLSSAFLHRTTYDASCKCRPHPWEKEALEQHQQYAGQQKPHTPAQPSRP